MQHTSRILLTWFAIVAAGFGCGWLLRMGRPAQDSAPLAMGPVLREPVRKAPPAPLPPVPRLKEVLAAPASERAGMVARYLRTADVAGIKTLLEQEWAGEFRGLIALRWTAVDPQSAFASGVDMLRYWCANDPDAAYKWALENSRGREQVEAACKYVAASDPDRVLRWLANDLRFFGCQTRAAGPGCYGLRRWRCLREKARPQRAESQSCSARVLLSGAESDEDC